MWGSIRVISVISVYILLQYSIICGTEDGFVCFCVSQPLCSHVTPTVDCRVTVCAHIPIVYLVEQASQRPDVRFEVVSVFMYPLW